MTEETKIQTEETNEETNTQNEPYVNVVKSPWTGEFTLSLKNFDILDARTGYTEKDIHELIGLMERGIYHLNICIEDYKKENDGKESKRCNGCSETT